MFSKTLIASAENPAEPVTFTSSPPPGSLIRVADLVDRVEDRVALAVGGDVGEQQRRGAVLGDTRGSPNGAVLPGASARSSSRAVGGDPPAWSAAVSPPSRR